MSFTPSEIILGATVPLENGGAVTFSIAGHVEAERDFDDAVVIFSRKLLKYTNCATDADRLTVRQVVASITSTPLDKVPDVGTPTPPAPVKEPAKVTPPVAAPTPGTGPAPTAEEQAAAAVAQCIKPPVDVEDIARQQHADKLKADLERLQADHDTRVARWAATAPDPAPSAPPAPEASVSGAPQSGEVCVNCGAAVSASQAKLSQLFQSKTLCKKCMEATA
jgi:hypothetical protein